MFNFFKKRNTLNAILQNWQIPVDPSYRLMKNTDSIQFANADESIVLYFSMLRITSNSLLPENGLIKRQPSVTFEGNVWHFKAAKSAGNIILICVFTFTNENDEHLLRELFGAIVYIGK